MRFDLIRASVMFVLCKDIFVEVFSLLYYFNLHIVDSVLSLSENLKFFEYLRTILIS